MSRIGILSAVLSLMILEARAEVSVLADSTNKWGYGYDSLLKDLALWRLSPYVHVDSVGASSEGRALWMVSVSDHGDSLGASGNISSRKHRVFIHARTHPAEVQANYISVEAIRFLLDSTDTAAKLRAEFIFNIIPMYNPDGVEDGHPRKNAHLVDLESNWNQAVIEPEVICLRHVFEAFMAGPIPIEVALNLHSDQVNCTRFFFFHYAAGTSVAYTALEKNYIEGVQGHFPGGIKDWNFVESWDDTTHTQYPEGFWWVHYKENVLALTYEDTNCPNAGRFDSTGRALVLGSVDYIRNKAIAAVRPLARQETRMLPGPEGVRIRSRSAPGQERWELSDLQGRRISGGWLAPGENLLTWSAIGNVTGGILSILGPAEAPSRLLLTASPR